jgi:hypothetical protein
MPLPVCSGTSSASFFALRRWFRAWEMLLAKVQGQIFAIRDTSFFFYHTIYYRKCLLSFYKEKDRQTCTGTAGPAACRNIPKANPICLPVFVSIMESL